MDNNQNNSNNNNNQGNRGDNNKKKPSTPLILFIVSIILTLLFWKAYSSFKSAGQETISYSEFLQMLADDNVKDVKIYKNEITFKPVKQEIGAVNDVSYIVVRTDDYRIVDRLEEAGVEFVENNKAWMILRDKAEDGLSMKDGIDPVTVNFEPWMSDEQWYNRTYEVIGSSLLLAPDSVYKLVLEYSQLVDMGGTEKQWRAMSSEYTIRAPKNYEYNYDEKTGSYIYKPGYQYTVKIAVFGLSEIKVSANISNWEIVDAPIIINPDDADKENVN